MIGLLGLVMAYKICMSSKKLFSNLILYTMAYKRMRKIAPKKIATKRRSAYSMKSLARQVQLLQKKTKLVTENDTYVDNLGTDVVSPYVVHNLCNYSAWFKAWPSTSTAISAVRNTMYHKSITLDNLVTLDNINNEEGTVNFTYFVISRRDEAGTATDMAAAPLTLTANVDYVNPGSYGFVYMNLKKWRVHAVRRFTLTQMDAPDTDAGNAQRRFSLKIKVGKKISNPDASWKVLENSPDSSDTYYAVLFNDNSTADLENPRWSLSAIHSINN